jgi:hypothetical protein
MPDEKNAADKEREMREHEREARERSGAEGDQPLDEDLGTPDDDAMPAPPGPAQGGSLGGAS